MNLRYRHESTGKGYAKEVWKRYMHTKEKLEADPPERKRYSKLIVEICNYISAVSPKRSV